MTRPGIELKSPGPLADTLTIMSMSGLLCTTSWQRWMGWVNMYKFYEFSESDIYLKHFKFKNDGNNDLNHFGEKSGVQEIFLKELGVFF